MKDLIVYCPDTVVLVAELREKFPERLRETLPVSAETYLSTLQDAEGGPLRTKAELADARDKAWRVARADGTLESNFLVDKTPTVRKGKKTLALVRCMDGHRGYSDDAVMLRNLDSVEVLGTWEEVQGNPTAMKKYNSVYPRTAIATTDEEGVERTYTPAEEIGRFA